MNPERIKQRDVTDCGAACLASVAAHFKLQFPVARIRQLASTDKKGTNVLGMIEAAEKIGLQAKGVKGTFDSLSKIPKPSIAHVIIKGVHHHYVVIYAATRSSIKVMDPADGQFHHIPHEEFRRIWSGVLILLVPGENFRQGNRKESVVSRFWKLVFPHRGILLQALVGACVYTIIGLSTSIYVQKIIDYVLVDGNQNLLNLMSIVMIVLLLMSTFVGYMKSLFTIQTGQMIDAKLILGYYKHLLQLPQQFFDSMRVGEILSRINDAVKIRAFINDVSINLAVNLFVILFSFALMFTYFWKLAVVILLVVPLYSIVYFVTDKLNKKVERKLMEDSAELESQLVESLHAVGTIKRFGLEQHANLRTTDRFFTLLSTIYKSGVNNLFSNFSSEFISRLFTIILLWLGAGFVLDNEITPGELLSFYALIGYFTGPTASLIGMNRTVRNATIAAERLFEIMDLEHEDDSNKIALTRDMIQRIEFRHVGFRYGTRVTVFEDFSLTLDRGKLTAIVGESGSGKSTLVDILQNLYPIFSGSVYLGQYDLKYIEPGSLRRLIGVVPQKTDLFAGNVVENIALGDLNPDLEKIIAIATLLGILEFIEKLPAGFATYLGENGATLSGGQCQRFAIARALYRDPEILILDEATSSLDSASEKYVLKMIDLLRAQNKTIILISHRLTSVVNADQIVVLENGKVAEQGTHQELLSNGRQYFNLWTTQFPPPRNKSLHRKSKGSS